jgi:hypothetical protein
MGCRASQPQFPMTSLKGTEMPEIECFASLFGPMFHYADDKLVGQSSRRYRQWAIDEIALISHIMRGNPEGGLRISACLLP